MKKNRKVQSEGADAEGGVAVGEGEAGVDLGELAAAEEAVAVGELGVVLDGALLRRGGDSGGGGVGPLPDGLGVAVVHRKSVDVAVALTTLPEGEERHNDENGSEHFSWFFRSL